jgi:hypothetical protein
MTPGLLIQPSCTICTGLYRVDAKTPAPMLIQSIDLTFPFSCSNNYLTMVHPNTRASGRQAEDEDALDNQRPSGRPQRTVKAPQVFTFTSPNNNNSSSPSKPSAKKKKGIMPPPPPPIPSHHHGRRSSSSSSSRRKKSRSRSKSRDHENHENGANG